MFDLGEVTVTSTASRSYGALGEDFQNGGVLQRDRRVVVRGAESMRPSKGLVARHGESAWRW